MPGRVKRKITITDVAARAGVSIGAVSAALAPKARTNIRISESVRKRIEAAAFELGYRPNPVAQALATRRASAIDLVFPYAGALVDGNPFCSQVMGGVFAEAVRLRRKVMLDAAVGNDWAPLDPDEVLDPRLGGVLLVTPDADCLVPSVAAERGIPCVSLLRTPIDAQEYCVNADDFGGALAATEHLVTLGHRRIAHAAGSGRVCTSAPRRAGYETALRRAGIVPDPALVAGAGFDEEHGARAVAQFLELSPERRPTALVASNDLAARGAIRMLEWHNLKVPDDVSVVGFDDSSVAVAHHPLLTTVRVPIASMAGQAVAMLHDLMEGRELPHRQIVSAIELVVRESSAPPA